MSVKCADCGFLSLRKKAMRELVETDGQTRETGVVPDAEVFELAPICLARAANLPREAGHPNTPNRIAVLATIAKNRECGSFMPWMQGFSPREHQEMLHNADLRKFQEEQKERERIYQERREERQEAFQRAMKADEQAWQERMKSQELAWQERQKTVDRYWHIGTAAFAAVFAGLVGWLFSRLK